MKSFQLEIFDQKILLNLARTRLNRHFKIETNENQQPASYSSSLLVPCGVFVSLHRQQQLRGCLGCFKSRKPLYEIVQDMAVSAALNDYRFEPVTKNELPELTIEISVLTPLQKIESPDEIILGRHGIYITDGSRSGTFLPQVATSTGWSLEEFLGHCSRDKAGLGWRGWEKATLYTYEAIVFSE